MDTREEYELVLRAIRSCPEVRQAVSQAVAQEWSRNAFRVTCRRLHSNSSVVRTEAGLGLHARAIVDMYEPQPDDPRLCKTLFDFQQDSKLNNVQRINRGATPLRAWNVFPGESVKVGVGIAFSMPPFLRPTFTPRIDLASSLRMSLVPEDTNKSDELAVHIVNESDDIVQLLHGHLLGNVCFQPVITPHIEVIDSPK